MEDIAGVIIKDLRSHPDDRGFFREIIRNTDPLFEGGNFGQWSHSKMTHGVVKAWHFHHQQTDWWYVPIGQIQTVLFDNREQSSTYKKKLIFEMGEDTPLCVKIPPGVLHGAQVLTKTAHLFYITSHTYNPDDEGRLPYNSEVVGHTWAEPCVVAENDKRTFHPPHSLKGHGK